MFSSLLKSFIVSSCVSMQFPCRPWSIYLLFPMLSIFSSKTLKIKILPEGRHTLALDQASLGEPRWWRTWVMAILHKLVKGRVWPWFLFTINPPGAATKLCTPGPPTTSTANTTTLIKKYIFFSYETSFFPTDICVCTNYVCLFIISVSPDDQKHFWMLSDYLHYSITFAWYIKLSQASKS